MSSLEFLKELLELRLEEPGRVWFASTAEEIAAGIPDARFAALLSMASRYAGRGPLLPGDEACARAGQLLEGWTPERWTRLEALRVALVLSRPDLDEPSGALAVEEAFRYADRGELCALYRSLAHLPGPERYRWRAAEGCRTNMVDVFEANVCDTPYPARTFDGVAWNQAVIKALFVGAPVWRIWGLDGRLSVDLARMALDLADERRSAHRPVQHELWLCLGSHGAERGLDSMERELASSNTVGHRAVAYGLARAGAQERLERLALEATEASVAAAARDALAGSTSQEAFRGLAPSP